MLLLLDLVSVTVLAALLAAACWYDVRSHRIPNRLVLSGMVAGIASNAAALASVSAGTTGGLTGFWLAFAGLATGFAVLLPWYLARSMGAGDVKLMAMVGSFLGPLQTVEAALMTLLAGGVLAVVVAAARGTLVRAVVNVRGIASGRWHPRPGEVIAIPASQSAGKLPYALAIAAGTAIHEVLARGGHSLFA